MLTNEQRNSGKITSKDKEILSKETKKNYKRYLISMSTTQPTQDQNQRYTTSYRPKRSI